MANISDSAHSQGDLIFRIQELEREVRKLKSSRRLESSSIGSGGLRLIGGDITIDEGGNIFVTGGSVVSGDPEGERAEISATGYRLFNEDGEIIVDLTTEGSNQILLRGSGGDDNEILLSASGEINARQLNVDEIKLDGQDLQNILDTLASVATPTSEGADPDPPPPSGTITRRYTAIWSQAYQGDGDKNNFSSGLTQGFYSSTNGNQRSLIGFPSSTIQADHGGRTVTRVRVFLYFDHWFLNSGGTAITGYHGHSSEPSSFSANTDEVRSANWPKPGGRWVNLDTEFWASGSRKGISLGPGPSTSRLYYGNARAHNQSRPPRLEVRSVS